MISHLWKEDSCAELIDIYEYVYFIGPGGDWGSPGYNDRLSQS